MNPIGFRRLKRIGLSMGIGLGYLVAVPTSLAQEQYNFVLKNGILLKGMGGTVQTLDESGKRKTDGVKSTPLLVVDDGLRETFFHNQLKVAQNPAEPLFSIELNNAKRVSQEGDYINGILGSQGTPFDQFGRRLCKVVTLSGSADLLQGITEVTPSYIRVETMKMEKARKWDMRMSVQSIAPDRLVSILLNDADLKNEKDWLDIVSFFNQAKMYPQAIAVLEKGIETLPQLEVHRNNLTIFSQSIADQMFDEVQLRRNAGQYDLANALLRGFKPEGLALETQIKLQKRLQDNVSEGERFRKIVEQLREQVKQLQDPTLQVAFTPIVDEIAAHISPNTIDRMVDYERLRDDTTMTIEQRVAIGVAGWLLGPGVAVENLNLAKSTIEARELVSKYLSNPSEVQRREILQQIKRLESGSPRYIAPLISKMLPPQTLPKPIEGDPSRYLLEVPVSQLDGEITGYYLQLPPQYDPYRSYPCVLALHGNSNEEAELNWWAGKYNQDFQMASGEASRHGYIVISPRWNAVGEGRYQSTENEHARALVCLRDAMRRTSIDANRVFVAGHYAGADLAWDLALSHPDMWAGAVLIGVGEPTNFHQHYHESAKYVPLYFVSGALDGKAPLKRIGPVIDEYAQSSKNDFMFVQYRGRGRDQFVEELSRIMQWMDLASHIRLPMPEKNIVIRSSRPGDNFYWCLEVNEFMAEKMNHPLLPFNPKRVAEIKFERNAIANTINFEALPAKKYTLWLNPSIVDFSKKVKIIDKKSKTIDVTPSVEVLLEDVRMRADRQRPFWAKIE